MDRVVAFARAELAAHGPADFNLDRVLRRDARDLVLVDVLEDDESDRVWVETTMALLRVALNPVN